VTDIVKRLRKRDEYDRLVVLDHLDRPYGLTKSLEHEAADEIERLRAERDRLGQALEEAVQYLEKRKTPRWGSPSEHAAAIRALKGGPQ